MVLRFTSLEDLIATIPICEQMKFNRSIEGNPCEHQVVERRTVK